MRIGVLGTGAVGTALATRCVALGHTVVLGSRTADNSAAVHWAASQPARSSHGTFAHAAASGEFLINATAGTASLAALRLAGAINLGHKVLLDVSNPLSFSGDGPPSLTVVNDDSLGEQIQREFLHLKVVKALNTVNVDLMVQPGKLSGTHNLFLCGNDAGAKTATVELLRSFGWGAQDIIDLGDITAARAMEMYLPLWLKLMSRLGTPLFNVRVVR